MKTILNYIMTIMYIALMLPLLLVMGIFTPGIFMRGMRGFVVYAEEELIERQKASVKKVKDAK
jgi:hypothetical protein